MDLGPDTEDVVGSIVLYHNKILLVKGVGGKWSFPKGRRRENETKYEGAIREALEEAGIDLAGTRPDFTLNLRYGTYFVFNLWRHPTLSPPTTPEEILEVAWKNVQSMKGEEKNADLKFYFKEKRRGNLNHGCCWPLSTLTVN